MFVGNVNWFVGVTKTQGHLQEVPQRHDKEQKIIILQFFLWLHSL